MVRKRLVDTRQEPQTLEDAIRVVGPVLWRDRGLKDHAIGHLDRIAGVICHRRLAELKVTDLDDVVYA
jgi:hypothetical protein